MTFSLPGRISYLAFQPCSRVDPMRETSWRLASPIGDSAGARRSSAALGRRVLELDEPLVGRFTDGPMLDFTTVPAPGTC